MNKVTTVVVTYNGEKWIRKCLNSLKDSTIQTHVIVIDNKSTDSTVQIIEQEYNWVELIKSKENLGFGQANNLGLIIALKNNADYVFLLNQDAWLYNDKVIDSLIKAHLLSPDFGIISPIHIAGNGKALDAGFSYYLSPLYNCSYISDTIFLKGKNLFRTDFVNAAAWLISGECIKKVGGFDPLFFHYGEDYNYCQRVQYHKLKIGIFTDSFIVHDRPQINPITDSLKKTELQLKFTYLDINKSISKKNINFRIFKTIVSLTFSLTFIRIKKAKDLLSVIKQLMIIRSNFSKSRRINKAGVFAWLKDK